MCIRDRTFPQWKQRRGSPTFFCVLLMIHESPRPVNISFIRFLNGSGPAVQKRSRAQTPPCSIHFLLFRHQNNRVSTGPADSHRRKARRKKQLCLTLHRTGDPVMVESAANALFPTQPLVLCGTGLFVLSVGGIELSLIHIFSSTSRTLSIRSGD